MNNPDGIYYRAVGAQVRSSRAPRACFRCPPPPIPLSQMTSSSASSEKPVNDPFELGLFRGPNFGIPAV